MSHASTALPSSETSSGHDWRRQLPVARRRQLQVWFVSVALLTVAVLIVGGITRLTRSGLSIVEWDPLFGVIPPLNHEQWRAVFERYQQFPEYQLLRQGMSLAEFQYIYFWEYTHRVLARLIGVVFLVPFAWFWAHGYLNRQLLTRALLLFALGAMQGLLGWLMVASGLVDRPSVSHYRLAAHLGLAFLIFGYALWLARELALPASPAVVTSTMRRLLARGLTVVGVLLVLQIIWGAFVAGLRAGHFANSFPLMGGRWVPAGLLAHEPPLLAFLQNPVTVQWTHRLLGTVLAVAVVAFVFRVWQGESDVASRKLGLGLLGLVVLQYTLGVLTLVNFVPVELAVSHQVVALLTFGTWVWWVHHLHNLATYTD